MRMNSYTWGAADLNNKMKYFSSGPFVTNPMIKKPRRHVLSPQPTDISDLLAIASMGCESPGINDREVIR